LSKPAGKLRAAGITAQNRLKISALPGGEPDSEQERPGRPARSARQTLPDSDDPAARATPRPRARKAARPQMLQRKIAMAPLLAI
jgi:hypothetical protein